MCVTSSKRFPSHHQNRLHSEAIHCFDFSKKGSVLEGWIRNTKMCYYIMYLESHTADLAVHPQVHLRSRGKHLHPFLISVTHPLFSKSKSVAVQHQQNSPMKCEDFHLMQQLSLWLGLCVFSRSDSRMPHSSCEVIYQVRCSGGLVALSKANGSSGFKEG